MNEDYVCRYHGRSCLESGMPCNALETRDPVSAYATPEYEPPFAATPEQANITDKLNEE